MKKTLASRDQNEVNDLFPAKKCSTIFWVIFHFAFFVVFMGFGIALLVESRRTWKIEYNYGRCELEKLCRFAFEISEDIEEPIHISFKFSHYYQNLFIYKDSRSPKQLQGNSLAVSEIQSCYPIISYNDTWISNNLEGDLMDPEAPLHPCGLVAQSFFNDTFSLYKYVDTKVLKELEHIYINETGIAIENEKKKYKNLENYTKNQWTDVENEHFIVWMTNNPYSSSEKLWGRLPDGLKRGHYILNIDNHYNADDTTFNEKFVVFRTLKRFGTSQTLIGAIMVFSAITSLFIGILFLLKLCVKSNFF